MGRKEITMKKFFENCTTEKDLKKAWRAFSKEHHPDNNNGVESEEYKAASQEYNDRMNAYTKARRAANEAAEEAKRKAEAEAARKKAAEEKAAKKAAKEAGESKFDRILKSIPQEEGFVYNSNSKRTAVHVMYKGKRVFGHSGPILVVTREELLEGITGAEKKNYGWRVEVTEENMRTLMKNAKSLWG